MLFRSATQLSEVFNQQGQGNSRGSGNRTAAVPQINPAAVNAASAAGGASPAVLDPSAVQIFPVTRTNSILMIAHPLQIAYIEELIEIFDAPSDIDNFLKRELRYLSVTEFMPIAADALSIFLEEGAQRGSSSAGGRSTNRTTGGARNLNTGAGGIGGGSTNTTFGGGGSSSRASASRSSTLQSQDIGGPESIIVGNTLLIGDAQQIGRAHV